MAHVLDRVPVDRITVEAREVNLGRTFLTLLAGLLFGIGWVGAKVFGGLWLVLRAIGFGLAWCGVAVRLGWRQARTSRPGGDG